jgi:hypothetical protein
MNLQHRASSLVGRGVVHLPSAASLALVAFVFASAPQTTAAQVAAAGAPIINCNQDREQAVVYSRGLDGLNDKIARMDRQLSGAKSGRMDPEAAKQAADARRDLPVDVTLILSKTDQFEAALAKAPLTPAARTAAKVTLEGIRQSYEKLYKGTKAVNDLGNADVETLAQKIDALHRLMVDTGSYEELGARTLENAVASGAMAPLTAGEAALAGPIGGLALAVGVYAIDTIYAEETAFQNTLDATRAADTLNRLRSQRSDIMELIENVVKNCGAHDTQRAQESPRPIAPSEAKPTAPPKPPSGGGSLLKPIIVTAALAGGAIVGASAYSDYKAAQNAADASGGGSSSGGSSSSTTLKSFTTITCVAQNSPSVGGTCTGTVTISQSQSAGTTIFVVTDQQALHGGKASTGSGDVVVSLTNSLQLRDFNDNIVCPRETGLTIFKDSVNGTVLAHVTVPFTVSCR